VAARRAPLRSVPAGAKAPAKASRLTVAQAAETGDHRALLVAMRERIAASVSSADCPPRDLAALTRRLQDVAKEIEALDVRALEEAADDDSAENERWTEATV
jgi:acyl-CoA hydrolase